MSASRARRYIVRRASSPEDLRAAQELRRAGFGLSAPDRDAFDAVCTHMLIEDRRQGRLVGCFRILPLASAAEIGRSYSAQFYDLHALASYPGPITELGRFCIHPPGSAPDILRAAWAALTAHVDACGVTLLFGCSSFPGMDPASHRAAFAALARRHLAPDQWAPQVRAPQIVPLQGEAPVGTAVDMEGGLAAVPPLLRSYLAMGGWVSDHAVVDPVMNTLHVFTGLEIARIPARRQRLLRALLDAGGRAG